MLAEHAQVRVGKHAVSPVAVALAVQLEPAPVVRVVIAQVLVRAPVVFLSQRAWIQAQQGWVVDRTGRPEW